MNHEFKSLRFPAQSEPPTHNKATITRRERQAQHIQLTLTTMATTTATASKNNPTTDIELRRGSRALSGNTAGRVFRPITALPFSRERPTAQARGLSLRTAVDGSRWFNSIKAKASPTAPRNLSSCSNFLERPTQRHRLAAFRQASA
jgi:hypothetical protein